MPFVELPIETDPGEIAEEQKDFIRQYHENYDPAKPDLDNLIIEGNAQESAAQRFHLQEVSEEAPRVFGPIVGVPPEDPAPATGTTTWVFADTTGHTIPAGTEIEIAALDGTPLGFRVLETVEVPVDEDTVEGVAIEAVEEGAAGSGLSGEASLLSDVADVTSITVEGVTSGGTDGETGEEFLDRFSDRMRLLADRLIHADDFALYYRTAITNCARAVSVDNYDPADETYDNEGMVTVVGHDSEGEPLAEGDKADALEQMQDRTVAGLVIHIEDPTYTEIDVDVEVVALEGFDLDVLQTEIENAITDFLDPAKWSTDPTGTDGAAWINERYVRYLEASEAINRVLGTHYILEPTLLIEGLYNQDIELTGVVPLTRPGTINVIVHPPGYEPGSGS